MRSGTRSRLLGALLARGVLLAATATTATIGACAAQASRAEPAAPPTIPDELADPFDLPDGAPIRDVGATARADLPRLLDQGEAAYRARRAEEALAAFHRVVTIEPNHALAWLRIGNLHQQRGDSFKALSAYRKVAARSGGEGFDGALRAKALYNLAMINLELAQQTLRTLERIGPAAAAAGPREPLSAAVAAARRRLDAFAPPAEPARRAATGGARDAPAPAPAPVPVPVPVPVPELPRIDYIRGAPRP